MNTLLVICFSCCFSALGRGMPLRVGSNALLLRLLVILTPSPLAFLPSTFAMYFVALAMSFAVKPPSKPDTRRTVATVLFFATGAVVGWPFSLLLAVPYVWEELFVAGGDRVKSGAYVSLLSYRWPRLFAAGIVATLVFVSSYKSYDST